MFVCNVKDLQKQGAHSLLSKYNSSPYLLLSAVYPEYNWLPWRFKHTPKRIWEDKNIVIKFMEWAKKELKIKEWNKVTKQDIMNLGGKSLFDTFKTLPTLLSFVYPELNFQSKSAYAVKTQSILRSMLKTVFPKQGRKGN